MKQANYNLIFVTTCVNNDHIGNLINSIASKSEVKLLVVVVNQGGFKLDFTNCSFDIEVLKTNQTVSLSKARNIALKHLAEHNVDSEYIMFPDDDTTFDDLFFSNLPSIYESGSCFITPIFVEGSKKYYLGKPLEENLRINRGQHSLVGSPNQIILYRRFKEYVYFNEELGVGAKYGSSEDLDIFLRLNKAGAVYKFTNKLYSYHPDKTSKYNIPLSKLLKRFLGYGKGFAFIIFKYNFYHLIPLFLVKPVGASVIFMLRGRFKLATAYAALFFIRVYLIFLFAFKKMFATI